MNGAEAWLKLVQEMQWKQRRCNKQQGAEAALPRGLEPGQAAYRLFPSVPLAHCLTHSKEVHHLSAFLSLSSHVPISFIQLYCEPPEPHRNRIKSLRALSWLMPAVSS